MLKLCCCCLFSHCYILVLWPKITLSGQWCESWLGGTRSGLTKNSKMQSDDPNGLNAVGDDPFTETIDSWIVTLQPCGTSRAPESVLTDTTMDPETMGADTSTSIQGQPHQFGPQSGARPKLFGPDLPTPVLGKPPPPISQLGDFSNLQPTDLMTSLMDTVAQLQSKVYALKFALSVPPTPTPWIQPAQPRLASFTTTEVPKFSGSTSWDRNRQVFDATIKSNGWDDATVALYILSHLEGDALNVALLVPEATWATQIGLVGALTDHYGSPGRLADFRHQFERTVRRDGDDLSDFAVALETLAGLRRYGSER